LIKKKDFDVVVYRLKLKAIQQYIQKKLKTKAKRLNKRKIHIHLIRDNEIKTINQSYRKKNATTDVLSFDYTSPKDGSPCAGEIYISWQTASRVASQMGHPLIEEVLLLTIHGLLHILGYDHELSEKAQKLQATREFEILKSIKLEHLNTLITR